MSREVSQAVSSAVATANCEKSAEVVVAEMRVIIWKQWKVPAKREWGLRKLGIKKWQAHLVSYIKGYVIAAHNPAVKKAIKKEILTERKDLISPLDYYLERHALKLS